MKVVLNTLEKQKLCAGIFIGFSHFKLSSKTKGGSATLPLAHLCKKPLPGFVFIRGASKIKLKKVNKKRTVTVRGVIIFLNISRRPLRICLHCCLHQYKTLKVVATAMAVIVLLTPAKNLNKVFWVFLVVSPLFNHYQGYE